MEEAEGKYTRASGNTAIKRLNTAISELSQKTHIGQRKLPHTRHKTLELKRPIIIQFKYARAVIDINTAASD